MDPLQSKPNVKKLKDAKTVQIKTKKDSEVVFRSDVNSTALEFIRSYKKDRDKNKQ